jgi:hypothetical protein
MDEERKFGFDRCEGGFDFYKTKVMESSTRSCGSTFCRTGWLWALTPMGVFTINALSEAPHPATASGHRIWPTKQVCLFPKTRFPWQDQ